MADWYCPNCGLRDSTPDVRLKPGERVSRVHTCPALGSIMAPMLPAGLKAKVYAREREDYVGTEKVLLNSAGRPIMSVVTEREDGQDAIVFAPTATASVR